MNGSLAAVVVLAVLIQPVFCMTVPSVSPNDINNRSPAIPEGSGDVEFFLGLGAILLIGVSSVMFVDDDKDNDGVAAFLFFSSVTFLVVSDEGADILYLLMDTVVRDLLFWN